MKKTISDKKILIIDDDPMARTMVAKLCNDFNVFCKGSSEAIEGLNLLQKEHFNLVIMDFNLPNISGLEMTEYIRSYAKMKHNKDVPIVGISSITMEEGSKLSDKCGMNGFIPKPISREQFSNIVLSKL